MAEKDVLEGKRLLVVDDEPDVLDTLVEMLDTCHIDTASSYESGKELLETQVYDAAILDIMGVRGFELLKIATVKKIPAESMGEAREILDGPGTAADVKDALIALVPAEDRQVHVTIGGVLTALRKVWEKLNLVSSEDIDAENREYIDDLLDRIRGYLRR